MDEGQVLSRLMILRSVFLKPKHCFSKGEKTQQMGGRVTISDYDGSKTAYIRKRTDCVAEFSPSPWLCDNRYRSKSALPVASQRVFRSGDKWGNDNNYSHAFWFGNVLRTKSSFLQNCKACPEMKGNTLWINFYLITYSL